MSCGSPLLMLRAYRWSPLGLNVLRLPMRSRMHHPWPGATPRGLAVLFVHIWPHRLYLGITASESHGTFVWQLTTNCQSACKCVPDPRPVFPLTPRGLVVSVPLRRCAFSLRCAGLRFGAGVQPAKLPSVRGFCDAKVAACKITSAGRYAANSPCFQM